MSGGNWKDMFKAIQNGDIDVVDYYLQKGINPNYQHPEFMAAPLVESIRFGHLEIAKLLLENGANPIIKEDFGGETPFSVAKTKKNQSAMDLISAYIDEAQI